MRFLLTKVCGLTTAEDARAARNAGANLLGFVVHPASPRHCVDLRAASRPVWDRAVLVTVGDDAEAMMRLADGAGLRWIQPHAAMAARERVAEALHKRGFSVIQPWPDAPGQRFEPLDAVAYFLWEPCPAKTGVAGGSGQAHGAENPPPGPYLLAGGLDGDTLLARAEALPEAVRPHLRGFDAASRLEAAPGRKDPHKVEAFLSAAAICSRGFEHAF